MMIEIHLFSHIHIFVTTYSLNHIDTIYTHPTNNRNYYLTSLIIKPLALKTVIFSVTESHLIFKL